MFQKIRQSIGLRLYRRLYAEYVDVTRVEPCVSFTFDDYPVTAWTNGASLLEKYDARGTFYLAPELCGMSTEVGNIVSASEVGEISGSGHELGNHTFSHLDCSRATKEQIRDDLGKASRYFEGMKVENFSFPFGATTTSARISMKGQFCSCRGIESGINGAETDLLNLKANPVYAKNANIEFLTDMISEVKDRGGWLIFYTHDVCKTPGPYGCTETMLETLVSAARANQLPVRTVRGFLEQFRG